jgi:hypothetical protein
MRPLPLEFAPQITQWNVFLAEGRTLYLQKRRLGESLLRRIWRLIAPRFYANGRLPFISPTSSKQTQDFIIFFTLKK